MDRTERNGLSIATAGHLLLFGALSVGLLTTSKPKPSLHDPMEVQLIGPVAPRSAAPNPATEAPAPAVAPEAGPAQDAAPPEPVPAPPAPRPVPPPPVPQAKVDPKDLPDMGDRRRPDRQPAKAAPTRTRLSEDVVKGLRDTPAAKGQGSDAKSSRQTATGSRLGKDFLKGITDGAGKGSAPRAAMTGAQTAALEALLRDQLRPYWSPPAGSGVSELITTLRLHLNRDGSVIGALQIIETTGVNDENGRYVRQHQEAAKRAVLRAQPFKNFPPELYDRWNDIAVDFDAKLSL